MKYFRLPLFLLAFCVLAAGCDSNGGDDDDNDPSDLVRGQSSVTITGDHTESADASGIAAASNLSPGWGVLLGSSAASASVFVIASDLGSRPSPGSYQITNAPATLDEGQYRASLSVNSELFASTGGTLTITESSATEVKGTYTFNASGVIDTSRGIIVSGSFFASNQEDPGAISQ